MRSSILLVLLLFVASDLQAQSHQSAAYDAAALLNAWNNIDVLAIPQGLGYTLVDPLTGAIDTTGVFSIPPRYLEQITSSNKIIRAILARYANLPDDAPLDTLLLRYQENPFLRPLVVRLLYPPVGASPVGPPAFGLTAAPPTSSGAKPTNILTNIANGAADFLLQRAEDEISISIFAKLQQYLKQYPEVDTLFPHTCAIVNSVAPYDFSKTLQSLKDAVNQDLGQLIARLGLLYQIPRYQLLTQRVPALTLVFSASSLLSDLDGKYTMGRSLYRLNRQPYLDAPNNYASFLRFICILSGSLRAKTNAGPDDGDYPYVGSSFFATAAQNDPTKYTGLAGYYLGLLYQQTSALSITTARGKYTMAALFTNLQKDSDATRMCQLIARASDLLETADSALKEIKGQEAQTNQYKTQATKVMERYSAYADVIGKATTLAGVLITGNNDIPADLKTRVQAISTYWPPFASTAIQLVQHFDQGSYSLGVHDLSQLLSTVSQYLDAQGVAGSLQNDLQTKLKPTLDSLANIIPAYTTRINTLKTTLSKNDIAADVATDVNAEIQELTQQLNAAQTQQTQVSWESGHAEKALSNFSQFLDYVSLLASISTAPNSQAVENILESEALPAGSSRIKKVTAFNWALNAYVGVFYRASNTGGFTNTYGFTAPIGFTFSHGFEKAGSISLLAGVVDIGGIIQYKVNNQGGYDQNVSLAGLISPSVHLVYGFPWYLPISFGIGYQWVSPVTSNTSSIMLVPHFNAFLGVDIPIFNLKTSKL